MKDDKTITKNELPQGIASASSRFVKSKTIFSFSGPPPRLEEYKGSVRFEKIDAVEDNFEKDETPEKHKEESYYLYYDPALNKENLFNAIKSSVNYRNSWLDEWFAIQARDGRFLSVSSGAGPVGFSNNIGVDETFKFGLYLNHHQNYRPGPNQEQHLYPILCCRVMARASGSGTTGGLFYNYTGGTLDYDPVDNTSNPANNYKFHFDIFGIYGQPTWAANGQFKSFTLMNYLKWDLSQGDTRNYIGQSGNGLVGGDRIGWKPKYWLRYVDILEGVSLKSKQNLSQYGNMLMVTDASGNVSFENLPTWQPLPDRALFDVYAFYGEWGNRQNISMRVFLRSRLNGNLLSVNSQDVVRCHQPNMGSDETFLVEQGWGGRPDDINLKTADGKYFYAYHQHAKADTVTPVNFEQFEIIYP